jgi:DNA helicase HerA-like ATPase
MAQVLYADIEDMFLPARHTLVIGSPRSGKTSFLLKVTAKFYQLGEYVIIRDIGEFFEFLNLVEELEIPAIGFVPEGCTIHFKHPKFEQREFDIFHLDSLFDQFERDRLNLIMFEGFSDQLENHVWFWKEFFTRLLPWKRRPGNGAKRFCLVLDEFGDIAPGQGRYFIPEQNRTTQLIAVNHRKFRRHHVRMVAAIHYFRDITPPLRERFDVYLVKKNYPNEKEVPLILQPYAKKFPKLELNEAIFVDSKMNFNLIKIRELIKPRRYDGVEKPYIEVEGSVDELLSAANKPETSDKKEEKWKSRVGKLVTFLIENEILTSHKIGKLLDLDPSTIRNLKLKYSASLPKVVVQKRP